MGRGRAKAKQTKVARELKYNSPNMDLDRLKADLGAGSAREDIADDPYSDDSYEYDYADEDEDTGRR
ncbi:MULTISPECIES: DUF3073 domain-containing protein [unclassified Frankia]|uniref:DUF3073 domain-containing protein n=1 Tax=unclassified Frankia TaxID=2632575 RepID=UPI001EF6E4C5|nr:MULTISPECIES: DUF3073 domain-containing protein [unclassified Frankia]